MLTYKAMYKFVDGGVHAEVLDFPGAISCADDLEEARIMLASALEDVAESHLLSGRPIPLPNSTVENDEADLTEPIHLLLRAGARVEINVGPRRTSAA